MAITVRKGLESQFDINKMLPGEFAVTTDTHKVYVCMAAGISKELASIEELQNILGSSEEAFQAFQELINAMESDNVITGLLSDINNIKSGEYTISFSEAEERSNIESTDTIKVILGKIKKFFSSFATVAFSGSYNDISDTPDLSDVALSGSYNDLKNAPNFQSGIDTNAEAINELNTKINSFTTEPISNFRAKMNSMNVFTAVFLSGGCYQNAFVSITGNIVSSITLGSDAWSLLGNVGTKYAPKENVYGYGGLANGTEALFQVTPSGDVNIKPIGNVIPANIGMVFNITYFIV